MRNYLRLLKVLKQEFEDEKLKVRQNQERLDRIEQQLSTEYENEKLKIRQNQQRLDMLEQTVPLCRKDLDSLLAASPEGKAPVRQFNFLDKTTNAQSGEDAILAYVAARLQIPFQNCTYLDLGANRPVEGSNTNFFYMQGARGVLAEANPGLIPALNRERSEDVILNRCIDTEDGKTIEFIVMTEDGLSTVDEEEARKVTEINPGIQIKQRVKVESITINTIMETYFAKEPPVICSIDIEGKDLEILQSIDFDRHRPLLLVIEMIPYSNEIAVCEKNMSIYNYMRSVGYEEYAFTGINSIFIDRKALREKWGYKF